MFRITGPLWGDSVIISQKKRTPNTHITQTMILYNLRCQRLMTWSAPWASFQYPMRRLIVRSREVSKLRNLNSKLSNRSEIWQAPRQQYFRCACQISKRYDDLNYWSHALISPCDPLYQYGLSLISNPFTTGRGTSAETVGWTMCFLLMTLVPVQKLCVKYIYMYVHSLYGLCYIYIYIYNGSVIQCWRSCTPSRSIGSYFWGVRGSWAECHFLFSLVYQLCLALWYKSNTRMLVTFGICLKQHFDTRYLVFYNPSPPRMFLSLDRLWKYRIQHGANGPLYVTSSYSTWIFCRGVSGFATDCPCGVWCRGLTTCRLHVAPPFGNRI